MSRIGTRTFYDDGFAEIQVWCDYLGEWVTRLLPITYSQWVRYEAGGISTDEAFPLLDRDELEFLRSGMTPEIQAMLWGDLARNNQP